MGSVQRSKQYLPGKSTRSAHGVCGIARAELRGPEWVKVFHCDRFEAMLTKPDTMGIVSEAEEHGIGAELRSARELIEDLLIP